MTHGEGVETLNFANTDYRKTPKNSNTQKFAVITLKVEQGGFTLEKCEQKMRRVWQKV